MAKGLCAWGGCKQPPEPGVTYCSKHRNYFTNYHKSYRQKVKVTGRCRDCKNPAAPGRLFCVDCAGKARRRTRLHNLQHNYGITMEDLETLLAKAGNRCPLCQRPFDLDSRDHKLTPHVDHDHKTGQIRGLLCMNCNQGLGMFQDSLEILHRAFYYLKGEPWPHRTP